MPSITELCKSYPNVDKGVVEAVSSQFTSRQSTQMRKALQELQDEALKEASRSAVSGPAGRGTATLKKKRAYDQKTIDAFVAKAIPDGDIAECEGIMTLFEALDLDLASAAPFVFAYHFGCEGLMAVSKAELSAGMKSMQLMPGDVKAQVDEWISKLASNKILFAHFYDFCYQFTKSAPDARSIANQNGEACETLAVLYPIRAAKFAHHNWAKVVEHLKSHSRTVSKDLWRQTLRFVETIDDKCDAYDADDCWATVIDEYAEKICPEKFQ